jgi:hypothetical protein
VHAANSNEPDQVSTVGDSTVYHCRWGRPTRSGPVTDVVGSPAGAELCAAGQLAGEVVQVLVAGVAAGLDAQDRDADVRGGVPVGVELVRVVVEEREPARFGGRCGSAYEPARCSGLNSRPLGAGANGDAARAFPRSSWALRGSRYAASSRSLPFCGEWQCRRPGRTVCPVEPAAGGVAAASFSGGLWQNHSVFSSNS